jgi:hypothetical protein
MSVPLIEVRLYFVFSLSLGLSFLASFIPEAKQDQQSAVTAKVPVVYKIPFIVPALQLQGRP